MGYSRLMRDDEQTTIRTLTDYRRVMANLVQQHRGRVVDSPGDNLFAEFSSVVDAVNCAVHIQRELAKRNADLPKDRRMEFRIGVNLGDVLTEGERIYGYRFIPIIMGPEDPIRIHGTNERISVDNYTKMVQFHARLI